MQIAGTHNPVNSVVIAHEGRHFVRRDSALEILNSCRNQHYLARAPGDGRALTRDCGFARASAGNPHGRLQRQQSAMRVVRGAKRGAAAFRYTELDRRIGLGDSGLFIERKPAGLYVNEVSSLCRR